MTTVAKMFEPTVEQKPVFRCVNETHWTLASASERMRIHDHRWRDPTDLIPEHDYCARRSRTTHVLAFEGGRAFCPWAASPPATMSGSSCAVMPFVTSIGDFRP